MIQVSYPGVYVEEVPSGAFNITGVSTAVTAFVGRAVMGPVNEAVTCFSYGDYEAKFGGRHADYPLSYAVEDFFLNGGSEAVIVRLVGAVAATSAATTKGANTSGTGGTATPAATAAAAATATLTLPDTLGTLNLVAASQGSWAANLTAQADRLGHVTGVAGAKGGPPDDGFNLTLTYTSPRGRVLTERYTGVTLNPSNADKRVDVVLSKSNLARVASTAAAKAASDTPADAKGADTKSADPKAAAKTADAKTADSKTADSTATPAKTVANAAAGPTSFTGGSDGPALASNDITGDENARTGIHALDGVDLINILCIPWDARNVDVPPEVNGAAAEYCAGRRAVYVLDGRSTWVDAVKAGTFETINPGSDLGITDQAAQQCSAVYFPKIRKPDPERGGQVDVFSSCGVIAGQMARTDATRGVWKAPAGVANGMGGVTDLEINLTDKQQGLLNPIGVNCLRNFRVLGPLVWGARTLRGMDLVSDDYKYVPVRRLAHYIEESLYRGLKSAVFEPNDETLWSQVRLTVRSFMNELARQGAFYSFDVACDDKTTTQYHIDNGICVVQVSFAPVKPAEFVVLQIQQRAGAAAA